MQKLYLKILKRLSKNGVGQETDISDLFKHYFKQPPRKEIEKTDDGDVEPSDLEHFIEKTSTPRVNKICAVLQVMKESGWLTYTNNSVMSNNYNWVKRPINIAATLTEKGEKYYRENKNKWWELWSFWLVFIGVVIAGITAWLTYIDVINKSNVKHETKQSPHNKQPQPTHSSQSSKHTIPKTLPSDSSHK